MLLSLCSIICQCALSGPLSEGVRPTGLILTDKYHALKVDLRVTALCIVPTAVAIFFVWYDKEHEAEVTNADSTVAVSIAGTLIAFLTAFRSGQSYGRWFEGRAAFGRMHAGCRTLALYVEGACSKFELDGKTELAADVQSATRTLLLALIRSVILHLRSDPCNNSLKSLLGVDPQWSEEEALEKSKDYALVEQGNAARPMVIFKLLIAKLSILSQSQEGNRSHDTTSDYRMIISEYSDMVAAFNAADKLCNTPSPNLFLYLLMFVYVFFCWYLFPIMMSEVAHENYFLSPLVTFFVCYFFGLLITIAIDMDCPFDNGMIDLPLERYEAGLRKDMDMLLLDSRDGLDANTKEMKEVNPLKR